jgi:hypothetical protein
LNHQALFGFSEKQVYLFKHGIEVIKQRSSKQNKKTKKKKTSENEMSIFMTVIDDDDDIWMIK